MIAARKRALVTGGSGEIGSAICRRLVAAGYFVYVHAHSRGELADALVRELNGKQGSAASLDNAAAVNFDVSDSADTHRNVDTMLQSGPIQIVVNNAGIHDDAVFPGMSAHQWHRVVDVSVDGFFNVTQRLMLPMIRTRWGRIVNVSSLSAQLGNRGQVNYAAAKGALNAATRALATEVASRGITVNAVAPGIIDTVLTRQTFDAAKIASLVPMQRAGRPDEVAQLIGFLVSNEAAYITGQIIAINGGII